MGVKVVEVMDYAWRAGPAPALSPTLLVSLESWQLLAEHEHLPGQREGDPGSPAFCVASALGWHTGRAGLRRRDARPRGCGHVPARGSRAHGDHRITESQNPSMAGVGRDLCGPPAQPPAQAGSPRAGCTAPRPGGAGISPEKETPQPPWAACARAPSPSE